MIAVLDYGIGNLRSAEKALQHVGAAARLVTEPRRSRRRTPWCCPEWGVRACARALRDSGLEGPAGEAIDAGMPVLRRVRRLPAPLRSVGRESRSGGAGRLPGHRVGAPRRRQASADAVEHPREHVVDPAGPLEGLGDRPWVYFVHSFAPPIGDETVAVCDYGGPVAAWPTAVRCGARSSTRRSPAPPDSPCLPISWLAGRP